jgi:alpha-D-ribose 1-methylphosphonate 5-triphosphate synthase subunit PhnL
LNTVEDKETIVGIGVETVRIIQQVDTFHVRQNPLMERENFAMSARAKTREMIARSKIELFLFF